MMVYVKWFFWSVIVLLVGGFLHYTLPKNDVLRIVQTEVRRVNIPAGALFWGGSETSGSSDGSRDVKFISAVDENERTSVFRNEDTGWSWPPYFKFDAADVQATAADLASTRESPNWVIVQYYGWRSNLFSIFPNVLTVTATTGPDVRIIPWFNIVFLTGFGILVLSIRWALKRFWRRRIDPVVRDVTEAFETADDAIDAHAAATSKRFRTRRERMRE